MNTALFIAWFVSGLVGYALCRLNVYRRADICPSPFVIVIGVLASSFGPLLIGVAALLWMLDILDWVSEQDTWFTRPICRKD